MSAYSAMYQHRYGGLPARKSANTSNLADQVAIEMFGQEPFDPNSIPDFDDAPLFTTKPGAPEPTIPPSVGAAVQSYIASAKNAVPYMLSYDVRGGQDPNGQRYAQLTIDAHDPHGFIQRTANWALQAAGQNNVLVTAVPVHMTPGKVVLKFSQGSVPQTNPSLFNEK